MTGASDGIGKQYAIQLACIHQLNVLLISRSNDKLKKVAEEIGKVNIPSNLLSDDQSQGRLATQRVDYTNVIMVTYHDVFGNIHSSVTR